MSTLSQFYGGGSGTEGSVINEVREIATYDILHTASDGTKWLRAGFYETDLATYPSADPTIKGISSSNFGSELFTATSYTDYGVAYDGTYVYGSNGSSVRKYTKTGSVVQTSVNSGLFIYDITILNGWLYFTSDFSRVYRWNLNSLGSTPSDFTSISTSQSDTIKITSDERNVYIWCTSGFGGTVVKYEQTNALDGTLTLAQSDVSVSSNYMQNAFSYAGDGYFIAVGQSNLSFMDSNYNLVESQKSLSTGWPSAAFIEGATLIDGEMYFSERSTDKFRQLTTTKAIGIKSPDPYYNDQAQKYVRIS